MVVVLSSERGSWSAGERAGGEESGSVGAGGRGKVMQLRLKWRLDGCLMAEGEGERELRMRRGCEGKGREVGLKAMAEEGLCGGLAGEESGRGENGMKKKRGKGCGCHDGSGDCSPKKWREKFRFGFLF